jgi:hypothetical protein
VSQHVTFGVQQFLSPIRPYKLGAYRALISSFSDIFAKFISFLKLTFRV